jgi:hypothetical protein
VGADARQSGEALVLLPGDNHRSNSMARIMKRVVRLVAATSILSGIGLYVYTLPGLRRLPKAKQRSLDGVTTIDDAVRHLQNSGKTGWGLVAAAQTLVNAKMEYSRRNGWDTAPRAFQRGMGYCQQQATALLLILRQLGIAARPVQALRCKFPPARIHEYWDPGGISGHMWLVVSIGGVEKDVCPGHSDNAPGKVHLRLDLGDRRVERRTFDLVLPARAIAIGRRIGI